jgi:Phage major capsid protein E
MPMPLDRLVRKEVALGVIREFELPQDHMGLSLLAPFMDVQSDDVIFNYTRGLTAGLAPARAEDAESEMAGKDESVGTGRASIIDWALKDHYDPSDVTRYREALAWGLDPAAGQSLALTISSMIGEWGPKLARDTVRRRRMLDNRFEWLIMTALQTNQIVYNDGKIKFTVAYGRPAAQTDAAPASGNLWSAANSDPIGDLMSVQQFMEDTYGVTMDRAIISKRIFRNARKSDKFTNTLIGSYPLYTVQGWSDQRALEVIAQQTGINFILYDSVYRTRSLGSNTVVNTKFLADDRVYMIPSQNDINSLDDMIGFGKMLTSPHPEGNFTPGFYEWERSTVDPWSYDVGTGCKAFPVLPHMDKTYTIKVL